MHTSFSEGKPVEVTGLSLDSSNHCSMTPSSVQPQAQTSEGAGGIRKLIRLQMTTRALGKMKFDLSGSLACTRTEFEEIRKMHTLTLLEKKDPFMLVCLFFFFFITFFTVFCVSVLKAFKARKASQDAEECVHTQDDSLWQGTQKHQNMGEHSEGPPMCVGEGGALC